MYGLAGFAVTSVVCALAPNVEVLIAGRALQGFAGALLVPGSLAILAATFEGAERGKAIGTWTAWSGIATVIGPGRGRRAGRGALVARDLLGQRAADHPHGADGARLREGEQGPRRRPRDRLGRDRALGRGAGGPRLRPDPAADPRLGRPDGLRAADRRHRPVRGSSSSGSRATATRCSTCPCSRSGTSRSPTSRRWSSTRG